MTKNCDVKDWRSRIVIGTQVGEDCPPAWLTEAYASFRESVVHKDYPCYFGSQAERRGSLYYSYVQGQQIEHLPQTIQTFLNVCGNIHRDKNNLVVFFEPNADAGTQAQHGGKFWNILQYLHDNDPTPDSPVYQIDPSDPNWDFPFLGKQFFIVGISPSYRLHPSRNLGPCFIMVFQPREVFKDDASGHEISTEVRNLIRERARLWDGIETHPDLNVYGHPGNREWAQYFISDDNSRATGKCPLAQRSSAHASIGDGENSQTPQTEQSLARPAHQGSTRS